jgi:hypothetical protein
MPSKKEDGTPSSNYRKPPTEYQFKKGKSGNPNGRPPKKKSEQPGLGTLGGGIADRLGAMAMEEATRLVTVREGDQVSEIPALQALLRTMFRASAQGDTKAGRQLLDLVSRTEATRTNTAAGVLEFAAQYKERYTPIFDQHELKGDDPPDKFPHPDDVIINDETGVVTIDGPSSKEQAGAQKIIRQRALETMGRYLEVEAALANDPANRALKREFLELKKYRDFLKEDSNRVLRRKAMLESRRALEAKPPTPKEDDTEDEYDE